MWNIMPSFENLPLVYTDPNNAYVTSLLHFDGANNSTTIPDSVAGTPWTVNGAFLSTAQSVFGGASIDLASGHNIRLPSSSRMNFGNGDFTIEGRVYMRSLSAAYSSILGSGETTWTSTSKFLMVYSSGKLAFGGNVGGNPLLLSTTAMVINTWYSFAISRVGSTIYMFINGVLQASATPTTNYDFSTNGTYIGIDGWDGSNSWLNGYIDEMRIMVGKGMYTANYTPAAIAFVYP